MRVVWQHIGWAFFFNIVFYRKTKYVVHVRVYSSSKTVISGHRIILMIFTNMSMKSSSTSLLVLELLGQCCGALSATWLPCSVMIFLKLFCWSCLKYCLWLWGRGCSFSTMELQLTMGKMFCSDWMWHIQESGLDLRGWLQGPPRSLDLSLMGFFPVWTPEGAYLNNFFLFTFTFLVQCLCGLSMFKTRCVTGCKCTILWNFFHDYLISYGKSLSTCDTGWCHCIKAASAAHCHLPWEGWMLLIMKINMGYYYNVEDARVLWKEDILEDIL
jgi:hypothetical protein